MRKKDITLFKEKSAPQLFHASDFPFMDKLRAISIADLAHDCPVDARYKVVDSSHTDPKCSMIPRHSAIDCLSVAGGTAQLSFIDCHNNLIRNVLVQLSSYCGCPVVSMHANVYYSKASSGFPWHTDNDNVFTLQLSGKKKWRFQQPRVAYAQECYPEDDSALEVVLGPGQCLTMPKGWWHKTEGIDNSLSIAFIFL